MPDSQGSQQAGGRKWLMLNRCFADRPGAAGSGGLGTGPQSPRRGRVPPRHSCCRASCTEGRGRASPGQGGRGLVPAALVWSGAAGPSAWFPASPCAMGQPGLPLLRAPGSSPVPTGCQALAVVLSRSGSRCCSIAPGPPAPSRPMVRVSDPPEPGPPRGWVAWWGPGGSIPTTPAPVRGGAQGGRVGPGSAQLCVEEAEVCTSR